jgi:hypothetical protein
MGGSLNSAGVKRLCAGAALVAALTLAGCGIGTAPNPGGASLEITHGFGATPITRAHLAKLPAAATDLSLVRRFATVQATKRGRITSVDGAGAGPGEAWSLFVNGIAPVTSPARTALNPGDQVWLDLRPTVGAPVVAAVVGSYPEPFTTGSGGREYPTTVDCTPGNQAACDTVAGSLARAGVKVADQALGGGSGQDSLSVVVGTFAQLRGVIAAELLAAGPAKSGVYGQFVGPGGRVFEADDPYGNVSRTLRGSVGLIAATEEQSLNAPTWLVTGTDAAGVRAAARALTPADLHDHYAVAVMDSRIIPLPLTATP